MPILFPFKADFLSKKYIYFIYRELVFGEN